MPLPAKDYLIPQDLAKVLAFPPDVPIRPTGGQVACNFKQCRFGDGNIGHRDKQMNG